MLNPLREAGRVLSKKNQDKLQMAADHMMTAHGHVSEVLGSVADEADPLAGADLDTNEAYKAQPYTQHADETVQCPECGKMNDTDARYCDQCGAKLQGASGVKVDGKVVEAERLAERDFSQDQRDRMAAAGDAMPDGSYPIANKSDLENAVRSFGRAKNQAAVKAHIIKRAKALGATDLLPADWDGSTKQEAARLVLAGDVIPLVEKAVKPDTGTIKMKVIQPGWGSSAYYPAEVLERDGPKAFPTGTKMFWNHPSLSEEADRPERDLRDLAAVTTTPATWDANGPAGPGLYAEAKVFEPYRNAVEELAPYIGDSIRAEGRAYDGTVDGRTGKVLESITTGHSIDFVTAAGAGGEILSLFEAARAPQKGSTHVSEANVQQLSEALDTERARNDRLERALAATRAEMLVERSLGAQADLPDAAKARIRAAALREALPVKDGDLDAEAFTARLSETMQHERDYIATIAAMQGAGRVYGMGGSTPLEESVDDLNAKLVESLKSW